jgi:hypothetical protein
MEKKDMNGRRTNVPGRLILLIVGFMLLFSLIAPPILYEIEIRSYNPSGAPFHVLIISGIVGCLTFSFIALAVFLLMGIPTLIFLKNSPRRKNALAVEILISCIIAFILWWPNISQF